MANWWYSDREQFGIRGKCSACKAAARCQSKVNTTFIMCPFLCEGGTSLPNEDLSPQVSGKCTNLIDIYGWALFNLRGVETSAANFGWIRLSLCHTHEQSQSKKNGCGTWRMWSYHIVVRSLWVRKQRRSLLLIAIWLHLLNEWREVCWVILIFGGCGWIGLQQAGVGLLPLLSILSSRVHIRWYDITFSLGGLGATIPSESWY